MPADTHQTTPAQWPPGDGWTFIRDLDWGGEDFDPYDLDLAGHDGESLAVLLHCSLYRRKGVWYGPRTAPGTVGEPLGRFVVTHVRLRPYVTEASTND